jgi:hypothetical protein
VKQSGPDSPDYDLGISEIVASSSI